MSRVRLNSSIMHKKVERSRLINAVVEGNYENVLDTFSKYGLKIDDTYFDYELVKSALLRGDMKIVNFLLRIGCRVKKANKSSGEESPLHLAVKNVECNLDELVRNLINSGASMYDKNLGGDTPLQAAFKNGYVKATHALLNNCRPGFNSANEDDFLHFHIACVTNNCYAVEQYLKSGFDPAIPLLLDSEEYVGLSPIQFAVKENHVELFKRLVNNNSESLFTVNFKGLPTIHLIYYSSHPNNIKTWIAAALENLKNKNLNNYTDEYGLSYFDLCCLLDEPDFAQTFIGDGVNVNKSVSLKSPLNAGFTPLHFAVKYAGKEVINVLLKSGADPNKSDACGETPLHLACKKAENLTNGVIQLLLDYKASPFSVDINGCTSLHTLLYNVESKYFFSFCTLVSGLMWASTNYTDKHDLSLFHIACASNNVNLAIDFLNCGVCIDSCVSSGKYSGYTALHFAVMFEQKNIVQELLMRHAKVKVETDESKFTPLHLACEFKLEQEESMSRSGCNQLDIIRLLLSHGADVNAKDESGLTPLLRTCIINDFDRMYLVNLSAKARDKLLKPIKIRLYEVFKIFISNNANVNARTDNLSSILHILCEYEFFKASDKLINLLVTSGANVNAVNESGLTPLHIAVKCNNRPLVECLLKNNASPNIKCKNKNTILHDAVFRLNYLVIEKLLAFGADINMENSLGNSWISELLSIVEAGAWLLHSWGRVFKRIYIHIQQLLALKLPVSQNVLNCCDHLYSIYKRESPMVETHAFLDNIFDKSVKELDRMKNVKIDRYSNLYQMLLKTPHELAKYINNSRFIKIVKDRNMENDFPMYNYLLQLQFKRGSRRSNVLQSAGTALSNIFKISLPDLCFDSILKHLDNFDINNLKKVAPVKHNLKRKLHDNNSDQAEPASKRQKRDAK